MKKLFTLLMAATLAIGSYAKDYTDTLAVTVNGSTTTQTATISVDKQADGRYNFALKNFKLNMAGAVMGIGNIELKNLVPATSSKGEVLATDTTITISNGDDKSVATWMGPMLPPIPLQLKTLVRDDHLYTVIDINMASLNQVIHVTFGDRYQLPNSGFEDYRTEQTLHADLTGANPPSTINVEEPLHWHSFASASGDYKDAANAFSDPHTYSSDVVRSGATGKKSLLLTSSLVLGFTIANGTVTSGRMQAGSMTPSDVQNCAYLSLDSTATDSHGDLFSNHIEGCPDSLIVWVKFKQKEAVADHPYATVSAALTDGTYYRDPQDKTYNNVVGTAKDNKIGSNDFQWQEVKIPFTYNDNDLSPKAMLVTISTNADAGQGSAADSLYVDDISLKYGIEKPALSVDGKAVELSSSNLTIKTADPANATITPTTGNRGSFAAMNTISSNDNQKVVRILYCADDLNTVKAYTLTLVKDNATGINAIAADSNAAPELYNLAGQRISNAQPGQIVIVKKGDKTVKVLK